MWPVATDVAAWSVACLPVSLCWVLASCAKTGEPIEMPFCGLTHVGSRNYMYIQRSIAPTVRGTFEGDTCRPIVIPTGTHECIAHCLPAAAGEWTNAFSGARGGKMDICY